MACLHSRHHHGLRLVLEARRERFSVTCQSMASSKLVVSLPSHPLFLFFISARPSLKTILIFLSPTLHRLSSTLVATKVLC